MAPRRPAYCSSARKLTRLLNFSGEFWARPSNDGIGAVGLRSVEAIAAGRSVAAMCVSAGPGPLLPFSPITWQARQPDCPTTSSPARNVWASDAVRLEGGFRSTEFGEPVLAP